MRIQVGLTVLILTVLVLSCSSVPSDPQQGIAEGSWSGTSSEGGAITFTVAGNQVRDLQYTHFYEFTLVHPDSITWNPSDVSITNNAFSIADTLGNGFYNYVLNLSGTFDPPDHVSGMLHTTGTYESPGIHEVIDDSLSWSASYK